jgi:hypothetical protein
MLGHAQVSITLDLYSHGDAYDAPGGGEHLRLAVVLNPWVSAGFGCQFGCQGSQQPPSQDAKLLVSARSSGDRAADF